MDELTKRYPVRYRCEHCGAAGFTAKDGHPSSSGGRTCPTCKFGILKRMTWNGSAWH